MARSRLDKALDDLVEDAGYLILEPGTEVRPAPTDCVIGPIVWEEDAS